jgi:hypothetical protein
MTNHPARAWLINMTGGPDTPVDVIERHHFARRFTIGSIDGFQPKRLTVVEGALRFTPGQPVYSDLEWVMANAVQHTVIDYPERHFTPQQTADWLLGTTVSIGGKRWEEVG